MGSGQFWAPLVVADPDAANRPESIDGVETRMETPEHPHVVVLDLGSQYTLLIVKTLRQRKVLAVVLPGNTPAPAKLSGFTQGVIVSGGPASAVTEGERPKFDSAWFDVSVPVLGICLGWQLMATHYGGSVAHRADGEYGQTQLHWDWRVRERGPTKLNSWVSDERRQAGTWVWMSHMDTVTELPPKWWCLASTEKCKLAVGAMPDYSRIGVQHHPEVKHTTDGDIFLENWAKNVCGLPADWEASNVLEETILGIRQQVPEGEHVLMAVSGGVDSSIVATLMTRALGTDRVHCVFVDNGLLREGEVEQVRELLAHLNLVVVDAGERFLTALAGVDDPEQKRLFIGETFIYVLQEQAARLDDRIEWLAQGTLYSDVVESMSASGETIKTHHNVGGLPDNLGLKLIEPLRLMFKDEARALGRQLGLPDAIIERQPFPGPGLAIRVLGYVTAYRVALVRRIDAVLRRLAPTYDTDGTPLWQTFAVLLPVKAVGVMGDRRIYGDVCVIRSVRSEDAMTASLPQFGTRIWSDIADQIVREVPDISRVCFDLTTKPPGTIEFE